MASVQELIAAQEYEKSPLIRLLEGVAAGVGVAQKNQYDNAIKLMEIEKAKQAAELQREQRANLRALSPIESPFSKDKLGLKKTIEVGPNGITTRFEQPDVPKPVSIDSFEKALADKYNKGEMSLAEFRQNLAERNVGAPVSTQFVGMQGGEPVIFNPKTKTFEKGKLPGVGALISENQTEGQANASLYSERAEDADSTIAKLEKTANLAGASAGLQSKLPNVAKSADVQVFEQAQRNFINAVLRRESGAVISPTEFAEGRKQYFPQFGDSDEVLKEKRQNRKVVIAGLKNAAGIANDSNPQQDSGKDGELPRVGETFNGGKVLSIKRID